MQIGKQAGMVGYERTGVDVVDEFGVINGVYTAIGDGYLWGWWVGMNIYAGKDWIVI